MKHAGLVGSGSILCRESEQGQSSEDGFDHGGHTLYPAGVQRGREPGVPAALFRVPVISGNERPEPSAHLSPAGWNPLAFKTAAAEGDDMKPMKALAASGARLVVMTPAAIKVVF